MTALGSGALRQCHIDALARRAAQHRGAVRRVLEDKLQRLRAALAQTPASTAPWSAAAQVDLPSAAAAGAQTSAPAAAVGAGAVARALPHGPLASLLAHIHQHTGAAAAPVPWAARTASAAPLELKAIRDYRSTWARLGTQARLHQALAQVPDNAGPLNTQRLLHQALRLMQDTSPAYLLHFLSHAEALLALDALRVKPG